MSTGSIPKLGDTSEGGPPGDVGKAISEGARGAEVGDCLACDMDAQCGLLDSPDLSSGRDKRGCRCNAVTHLAG